jgi:hypothetical protein
MIHVCSLVFVKVIWNWKGRRRRRKRRTPGPRTWREWSVLSCTAPPQCALHIGNRHKGHLISLSAFYAKVAEKRHSHSILGICWLHWLKSIQLDLSFWVTQGLQVCRACGLCELSGEVTLLWSSKPHAFKIKQPPFNKHLILGQIIIKKNSCKELKIYLLHIKVW